MMWQFGMVTLGTFGYVGSREFPVCAALAAPRA